MYHWQTYCKRTGKGRSLNRKEITKEEILEYQEGRNNMEKKYISKNNRLLFPPEFSKLCLIVKTKIKTMSDVVLNIYK